MTERAYPYGQLVRVLWFRPHRKQVKVVAAVLAEDENHALQICEAMAFAMVPRTKKPRPLFFQTSPLGRNATVADMHAKETPWKTFEQVWQ